MRLSGRCSAQARTRRENLGVQAPIFIEPGRFYLKTDPALKQY
jgi:hypothetical protein